MKFNIKHFTFDFRPWRVSPEGWKIYYEVINKPQAQRTKFEQEWLKRVRKQFKASEVEVSVTHTISGLKDQFTVKTRNVNRKNLAEKLIARLRGVRLGSRRSEEDTKDWGGVPYNTVGGVFNGKGNAILEIAKHPHYHNPTSVKKPRSKALNYIGVELEFNDNGIVGSTELCDKFKAAGLGKYVCVGRDASCGWEVRVLLTEDNWLEPLTNILKVITDLGFKVDHRCGTHVHLDMRNRDVKKAYRNFFYTQTFMRRLITRERKRNQYCKRNSKDEYSDSDGDRYLGINTVSYRKYRTLEIRMHHGTLNVEELGPWIKLLLRIANYKGDINKKVLTLKQAKRQYEFDETLTSELTTRLEELHRKKTPAPVPIFGVTAAVISNGATGYTISTTATNPVYSTSSFYFNGLT